LGKKSFSIKEKIQSTAFHHAILCSERTRIIGLVCGVLLLLATTGIIVLRADSQAQISLFMKVLILSACVISYELLMFGIVEYNIRKQTDLALWGWILNLFIETLSPTILLLLMTESSFIGPYRALTAPAALLYFFFIILSTLRLSPPLCVLTGLFSFLGYTTLYLYTRTHYPLEQYREVVLPLQEYWIFAFIIFISGIVAGIVAWQIRKYVIATLEEAEKERRIQLFEREYDIARSIQQSLLPSSCPQTNTFDIAGWNQPAYKTGGDFYDWQVLPSGELLIVLADVCGHGIGPAMVTTACRAYIRACFESLKDLGHTFRYVNKLLMQELPQGRFITLAACLLDPGASQIKLLSAGQGPIILWSPSTKEMSSFLPNDMPLGISDDIHFDNPYKINLKNDDTLIFLTDGIFEWQNSAGESFGLKRLYDSIKMSGTLSSQELISWLYSDVAEFAQGEKQLDDVTIVTIRKISCEK
jgi:serine phosphatase RsbU (regulator of sigma subunit)